MLISRLPRRCATRWIRLLLILVLVAATAGALPGPGRAATSSSPLPAASRAPTSPPGPPIARTAGSTAALVVASRGDVPAALLTPANRQALGVAFHNTVAHGRAGRVAPVPVLLLGTRQAPTVKAVLAAIKRSHPVRLYLLGMTHAQRLTLVTNTLFDGLTVYINKVPGRMQTLAALEQALHRAARFQPVIQRHGKGVVLANAAQVAADTPITPPPGPTYAAYVLPAYLLPPVGDQGQESSCVGWSTSYYYRSFLAAKKLHWSPADPNHDFSPSFVYNQINGGKDGGSQISDAMSLLTQTGDVPIAAFPYQAGDYLTQPGNQLLVNAQAFHVADFGYLYERAAQQNPPDVAVLKRWLSTGDGLVIGIQVPDSFSYYTGGVYNGPYASDTSTGGHAMFVIGYDDNAEGTGIGAFRVINSWGTGWGESGYGWLGYDFLTNFMTSAWVMFDTTAQPTAVTTPNPAPQPTAIPTPAPRPQPRAVLYAASGSYTLAPSPAKHDFIATITFTYSATDQNGAVLERDQPVYHVEVAANSDTVFTLRYTMRDGTVSTAQVEVQAGPANG